MKLHPASILALVFLILLGQKMAAYIGLALYLIWRLLEVRNNAQFSQSWIGFKTRIAPGWAPVLLVFLSFFLLAAASGLWARDPAHWLFRFTELAWLFGLFLLALTLAQDNEANDYKWLAGVYLFCVIAMMVLLVIMDIPAKIGNRIVMTYALAFWIVLAAVLTLDIPSLYKLIFGSVAALLVTTLSLISDSQSAVLSLAGGAVAFGMTYIWPRFAPRFIIACVVLTGFFMPLIILAFLLLPPDTLTTFLQAGSAGHRIQIWLSTVELIYLSPWVGWGLDATRALDESIITAPAFYHGKLDFAWHPHNVFLQSWLDLGVFGVLVICAILIVTGLEIARLPQKIRPFGVALYTAVCAVLFVAHGTYQTWWLTTLILFVLTFPKEDIKSKN